jgi:predicted dehydrogenase
MAFTDLRKLLEDKSIDAVSIATPNQQHTLQTIWACQENCPIQDDPEIDIVSNAR